VIKIIFVCLGNICRSPLAEGVFRQLVEERGLQKNFLIDSAGTASYHVGEAPDKHARNAAKAYGFSIDQLKGRQFTTADLLQWDYIIAMDQSNHLNLQKLGPAKGELLLMREFDEENAGADVPDPWSQGQAAFHETYRILRRSCEKLLDYLVDRHSEIFR
jgi:protein-tyrosine phosphatase